nr:type I secretion system permease/ATPase [Cognatishimia sp. MH4019]
MRQARDRGRGIIAYSILFGVFVNLLMLTGPLFMLQVYDRVLASRSEETLVALFMLVALLYTLMGVLDYARGRILAQFGAQFQTRLDRRVFDAQTSSAARAQPTSGLRDLDAIQSLLSSPAMLAFLDVPWTPLFLAMIFVFHPMLGWLGLAGAATLILLSMLNQRVTRTAMQQAQDTGTKAYALAEEARQGGDILRAQAMQDSMAARWQVLQHNALSETIVATDWTGSFTAATKAFRLFLQSAMLALGAWLVLQDQMTAGAMIAASILLGRGLAPVEQSLAHWPSLQRARAAWTRLAHLLAKVPLEPARTPLPVPEAILEVDRLVARPPDGAAPTLRGLTFTLEPGQALGIIGRSGAGKSSLAHVLTGIWPPTSGAVRLGGAALDQYGADALGRHIGYLQQDVTLFSGTIAENIARMAPAPDASAVIRAAQAAQAHDLITRLPQGYDTPLRGLDTPLSGGQRQRIGLARALYGDPVLLILDEPNAALDADGSDALNSAIRACKANGRAVLIMTHRPMAISECDRLMVLEAGQITALGPRDEILKSMLKNASDVQTTLARTATA